MPGIASSPRSLPKEPHAPTNQRWVCQPVENEVGKSFSVMNAQKHCGNWPVVATVLRLHTLTAARTGRFLAAAKFTYIRLNMPTPCPPRSAVPVNRPFNSRRRCWTVLGHEFGKTCDSSDDVRQTVSLVTFARQFERSFRFT